MSSSPEDPFASGRHSLKQISTALPTAGNTQEVAVWLLGSAVEAAFDAFCITESLAEGGKILYVNPAFTRITGYELPEAVGETLKLLGGPATEHQFLVQLLQHVKAKREFRGELTCYRKDGSTFRMSWRIAPLSSMLGEVSHFLTVFRDVTEQRHNETVRGWLETAIETSEESVIVCDNRLRIQLTNPAFEKLTGLTPEQARDLPVWRLPIRPKRLSEWRQLASMLDNSNEASLAFEHGPSGMVQLLELTVTRVRDSQGQVAAYIARCSDVTEQRRLESVTEALNMTESLGYVFSGIRHELGNPINSMKAALSVLRKGIDRFEPDKVKEYLDNVLLEMGRVEDLLRSLRSFTAFERPTVEPIDANRFLKRFSQLIRTDLERQGIQLEVEASDEPLIMAADPRALHQIMLNLVTNAADAVANQKSPRILLRSQATYSRGLLEVVDNGVGFKVSDSLRVLQPFYTSKKDGTGLGLSISQKLVSRMGGILELSGEVGRGCRATVLLDLAEFPKNPAP